MGALLQQILKERYGGCHRLTLLALSNGHFGLR